MSKFYRVYSSTNKFNGNVITQSALEVLSLHPQEYKEIASVEIEPSERIYDVSDLPDLGYNPPPNEDVEEVELTEQSDDHFDEWDETNPDLDLGFDETDSGEGA